MREPPTILDEIVAAAAAGDSQALPALFLELSPCVLVFTHLPSEFFERLRSLLSDNKFLRLDESFQLVYFLNGNWDLLTQEQREQLRPLLPGLFDKHHNWMGAFIIGEMLGSRYVGEDTFKIFVQLSRTAQMPAQALVPHGLETLAQNTTDTRLRSQVVEELRRLSSSDVEQVREEARISLRKLGHAS
jgi:hypothetical protein